MNREYIILKYPSEDNFVEDPLPRIDTISQDEFDKIGSAAIRVDQSKNAQENRMKISPSMVTSLIQPTAEEDISEQTVDTWGIKAIGAANSDFSGDGVSVAVLDTGINRDHPAFNHLDGRIIEEDFTTSGNGDAHGHGTHVAATIFGGEVSGVRLGVAPNIKSAYIGKVLNQDGRGTTAQFHKGLRWALGLNADVICMSLGFDFHEQIEALIREEGLTRELATSQALFDFTSNLRLLDSVVQSAMLKQSYESGSVIIAAAGNESTKEYRISASLPAATIGVLSVGAIAESDTGAAYTVPAFSNSRVNLVAPGVRVVSARRTDGLKIMEGTSQACPHVAGAAALWWEFLRTSRGEVPASIVQQEMLSSCTTQGINPASDRLTIGAGLVQTPPPKPGKD